MKALAASLVSLAMLAAQEPSEFIAFRVDDTRVIVVVSNDAGEPVASGKPAVQPAARYGFPFTEIDRSSQQLAGKAPAKATRWTVHAGRGRAFDATFEGVVQGSASCSANVGILLTVAPAQRAAFAGEPARYFVANPSNGETGDARAAPEPGVVFPVNRKSELERVLNAFMERELPGIREGNSAEINRLAGSDAKSHQAWARVRQQLDAGLAAGRAQLSYDVQGFRLDPRGNAIYFVRAEWKVNGRQAFGAALWVSGESELKIVSSDLQPAMWLGMWEFQGRVARQQFGLVLNVVDRDNDGWREIIFVREGYEGFNIELLEFGPGGFAAAGASYGGGC